MSKKYAFIFPGQGAQKLKMGLDFYQSYPLAKEVFDLADDVLKMPLKDLIFGEDFSLLTQTKNSQVAIFVTSYALFRVVQEQFPGLRVDFTCGLSLGEYTAVAAADIVDFSRLLKVVQFRAQAMQKSAEKYPGGMSAVLGMQKEDLFAWVAEQQQQGIKIWMANLNCPMQQVLAGEKSALEEAKEKLLQKGAKRVIPLDVSGAFHSGLMEEAKQELKPLLLELEMKKTASLLAMNATGKIEQDPLQMRHNLIEQVTAPMRWEEDILSIESYRPTLYIEIGPSKILAGLNRKIGVEAKTVSIEQVSDLELLAKELGESP